MITEKVENILNKQIRLEAQSSQYYLAMASWAENNGLNGTAAFLYAQSDEERMHMLKLVRFVNERGGKAVISQLDAPPMNFTSINSIFQDLLDHEIKVTEYINEVVEVCLAEKDYTTHNFIQWFVSEQIEEEAQARSINDKLNMIGTNKGGLYLFDRDMESFGTQTPNPIA